MDGTLKFIQSQATSLSPSLSPLLDMEAVACPSPFSLVWWGRETVSYSSHFRERKGLVWRFWSMVDWPH